MRLENGYLQKLLMKKKGLKRLLINGIWNTALNRGTQ
jgi:hypothetical protein